MRELYFLDLPDFSDFTPFQLLGDQVAVEQLEDHLSEPITLLNASSKLLLLTPIPHIDGLVQERRNSSALAMELRLFCTNSLFCARNWNLVRNFYSDFLIQSWHELNNIFTQQWHIAYKIWVMIT